MSLSEAVLEVAKDMDESADGEEPKIARLLRGYAKTLKTLVKACEGSSPPQPARPSPTFQLQGGMPLLDPLAAQAHHYRMIEQARQELRAKGQVIAKIEEDMGSDFAEALDGPIAGDLIPIGSGDKPGCRAPLGGGIYILGEDRKFHWAGVEGKEYPDSPKQESKILLG